MEIKKNEYLINIIAKAFMNEADRLMREEYPNIFTPELLEQLSFEYLASTDMIEFMKRVLSCNKKMFSIDELMNMSNTQTSCFCAGYIGKVTNDDRYVLDKIYIQINTTKLAETIVSSIGNLDVFIEYNKITARHEVGHLIDYVTNFHNVPYEKYKSIVNQYDTALVDYYKRRGEALVNETDQNKIIDICRHYNQEYLNLPSESAANMYGCVDTEKLSGLAIEITRPCDVIIERIGD